MYKRLFDALRTVLYTAPAVPIVGTSVATAQSFAPTPAVPAAASKYDFQWEKYAVRTAPSGDAFYVFEGPQPVGVLAKGVDGKPELFPLFTGTTEDELRASLKRYEDANGNGARPLCKTPMEAPKAIPPIPGATRSGVPPVVFDFGGAQVTLIDGTRVEFSLVGVKVTMPSATPVLPATTVCFALPRKEGATGQGVDGIAVELNGRSVNRQRRGPVWDGIKVLVLQNALGRAIQAARVTGVASGRPKDSPDYLVLVKDMESRLN